MNVEKSGGDFHIHHPEFEKKETFASKAKNFFKTFVIEASIATGVMVLGSGMKRSNYFKIIRRFGKQVDVPFTQAVKQSRLKEQFQLEEKSKKGKLEGKVNYKAQFYKTSKSRPRKGKSKQIQRGVIQFKPIEFSGASTGTKIRSEMKSEAKDFVKKCDFIGHIVLALLVASIYLWKESQISKKENLKENINEEISQIKETAKELSIVGKERIKEEMKLLDFVGDIEREIEKLPEEKKQKFIEALTVIKKDVFTLCNKAEEILEKEVSKYQSLKSFQLSSHSSKKEYATHLVGALLGIAVGIAFNRSAMVKTAMRHFSQLGMPKSMIKKIITGSATIGVSEIFGHLTTQKVDKKEVKNLTNQVVLKLGINPDSALTQNKGIDASTQFLTKMTGNLMVTLLSSLGKTPIEEVVLEVMLSSMFSASLHTVDSPLEKKELESIVKEDLNPIKSELKKMKKQMMVLGSGESVNAQGLQRLSKEARKIIEKQELEKQKQKDDKDECTFLIYVDSLITKLKNIDFW